MPPIDEQAIVAAIAPFPPARRFWRQQRHRVTRQVAWSIEPDCRAATCQPQRDGTYKIWMREPLATLADAQTVCHELTHCLLDQDGYPSVGAQRHVPALHHQIAGLLNGLLDLEVDRRLLALGFTHDLVTLANLPAVLSGGGKFSPDLAERLTGLARAIGFDTPAKMRRLLTGAIAAVKPNQYLFVTTVGDLWQSQ